MITSAATVGGSKVLIGIAAVTIGVAVPLGIWAVSDGPKERHIDGLAIEQESAAQPVEVVMPNQRTTRASDEPPLQRSGPSDRSPVDQEASHVASVDGERAAAVAPAPNASYAPPPQRLSTPAQAGAPASPVAATTRCGAATCGADEACCNASCGICVPRGGTCSNKVCGRPERPVSVSCGQNTCNVGDVCCNPSCGICTKPGATCSRAMCDGITQPRSVSCGMNTCNVGEVCCNPSCGICTKPGGSCKPDLCG